VIEGKAGGGRWWWVGSSYAEEWKMRKNEEGGEW
jgi:hypothetical protein